MFSAFKKLTTKQENGGNSSAVSPGNVQCMSTNLQRKFAKVEHRKRYWVMSCEFD